MSQGNRLRLIEFRRTATRALSRYPDCVLARRFHPLLGRLSDAEIARRAGVSESTVLAARRNHGVPARQGRDLDAVSPSELLKLIRARARSGKSMRAYDLGSARLVRLAQRHLGGGYQAVEAAGLKPAGKPRKTIARPSKRPVDGRSTSRFQDRRQA